ncbi:MAG: hypothetical protein DI597_00885 [Pseudoxanthomonas spadix]|nr:MAG: hypothetical protein DI597_00885 [Pseudoxanthomonas spadix]
MASKTPSKSAPAKRGAKPVGKTAAVAEPLDAGALSERRQELVTMAAFDAATAESAGQLAKTVNYDGQITVPALIDGIRFYQHRTAEAALEIGKRLLLLKEITPHGEFRPAVERLGFSPRAAQRFMSATLKFSKANTSALLAKAEISQSNLLELVVLDDDELAALDSGESVNGITLDDVETMSTRELRAALREAKADAEAKDKNIERLSNQLNRAEEKADKANRAWKKATPDEQLAKLLEQARLAAGAVRNAIALGSEEAGLSGALVRLVEHAEANGLNVQNEIGGLIADLIGDLRLMRDSDWIMAPIVNDRRHADWQQDAEG